MHKRFSKLLFFAFCLLVTSSSFAQLQNMGLQNEAVDISPDFKDFKNTYYLADSLVDFNPETGTGKIVYKRYEYATRMAFNNMLGVLTPVVANEFPTYEYAASPTLPFAVEFSSPRTVRIRAKSGFEAKKQKESLMLVDGVAPVDQSWKYSKIENGHQYKSEFGRVVIQTAPWKVFIYDAVGKLLTSTIHMDDVATSTYTPILPFSYVRRAKDYSRSFSATFTMSPDEKIFGLGESFQEFNKRGQKVVLWTDDANGTQNESMYKPIPFYMSSRGYGVFMHTSTPITCDFGKYFSGANNMYIGDEELDLFVFVGDPKEILSEYTALTGRPEMPPLWSFGFWMSRITYFSQEEGLAVAENLRKHKVPADVLHFDTGWFETDWRCDYQFSKSRFDDPEAMMVKLKEKGIQTCLWQLPYFVPENTMFHEIIEKDLFVKNAKGNLPYEDAVLDFTNPNTIDWYQSKIKGLLDQGVAVIKVDFGEAAPADGIYSNGRTGFYEHNLYPLRYNKAVADITKETTGESIIWARSTWAGSQRYPLHWGGDAANTNTAMAAELRAGLSIGVSGFSFWSHDIGGFTLKAPEDVYKRWTPFGMLSSHVRSHGAPPTEPWEYGEEFLNQFRKSANLRYELMPYIYAQSKKAADNGWPMMRALFVEYPNDPGAWLIDNQYLFGSDVLVAPLFEEVTSRDVYLPDGKWIDYQTGKVFEKGWHHITADEIPVIMLVKDGTVLPHIKLAQSTAFMDWSKLSLKIFSTTDKATGLVCLPENDELKTVNVKGGKLVSNPLDGIVKFKVVK